MLCSVLPALSLSLSLSLFPLHVSFYYIKFILGYLSAEIFCLSVLFTDEFLCLKHAPEFDPEIDQGLLRFFNIASQLPVELQMVLSNSIVRLSKVYIPSKEVEIAFSMLARFYD